MRLLIIAGLLLAASGTTDSFRSRLSSPLVGAWASSPSAAAAAADTDDGSVIGDIASLLSPSPSNNMGGGSGPADVKVVVATDDGAADSDEGDDGGVSPSVAYAKIRRSFVEVNEANRKQPLLDDGLVYKCFRDAPHEGKTKQWSTVNEMWREILEGTITPAHIAVEEAVRKIQKRKGGHSVLAQASTEFGIDWMALAAAEGQAGPSANIGILEEGDEEEPGTGVGVYHETTGWYGASAAYWAAKPATVEGVSGTSAEASAHDIDQTRLFLEMAAARGLLKYRPLSEEHDDDGGAAKGAEKKKRRRARTRALDCGAGMGRLVNAHLARYYNEVDVIEPAPKMVEALKASLEALRQATVANATRAAMLSRQPMEEAKVKALATVAQLGTVFPWPMEQVILPQSPTYDFILVQWVLMYLTDRDVVTFLTQARTALRKGGAIFVKENTMTHRRVFLGTSKGHRRLSRSLDHYRALFALAGLDLVMERRQSDWSATLVPLGMYLLVPFASGAAS